MLSNEDWSYPEGGRCSCGTAGGEEVRRGEEGEEGGRGEGENHHCKAPLSACWKWYVPTYSLMHSALPKVVSIKLSLSR